MNERLTPRLAVLLTMPPLLWAGNAVVGRMAAGQVPPLTLNALRWGLVLLLLLPLGWRAIATPQARAQVLQRWRPLSALGLLGVGCYNALQYMALTTSSALNVTLIACSLPMWMMAIGALVFRERPTGRAVVGALLSLAGVLVVLTHGDVGALATLRLVPGDLLMLIAISAWATYSWLLARPHPLLKGEARPDWNWADFLLVQTLFGMVWAGAAAGVEAVVSPAVIHWTPAVVATVLYIAIGPSLVAYRCWGLGVGAVGPTVAALFGNLTPLFAAVMASTLLGEVPGVHHVVAFGLILTGIWVSTGRAAER